MNVLFQYASFGINARKLKPWILTSLQVLAYIEDFKSERADRERAQGKILDLQEEVGRLQLQIRQVWKHTAISHSMNYSYAVMSYTRH